MHPSQGSYGLMHSPLVVAFLKLQSDWQHLSASLKNLVYSSQPSGTSSVQESTGQPAKSSVGGPSNGSQHPIVSGLFLQYSTRVTPSLQARHPAFMSSQQTVSWALAAATVAAKMLAIILSLNMVLGGNHFMRGFNLLFTAWPFENDECSLDIVTVIILRA